MIVPDGLSIEELIGALKVEIVKSDVPTDEMLGLAGHLNTLEVIKRELDKKSDKITPDSIPANYCKDCLSGTHPKV